MVPLGDFVVHIRTRYVGLIFALTAFFVFSDFWIFGKVLIGNLDVADINFPNLLLAKRNFLAGEWGLWNPFVSAGSSVFSNAIAPQFYPENWLLFWLPESVFFKAVTFVSFLKFWGIGFFAYLWFCKEVESPKWALFAAIAYQLSGFSLWTVISSDAISLSFYFTCLAALIWRGKSETPLRNFLAWSFFLWQIFYCSNYVYSAYLITFLIVLFFYRHEFRAPWLPFLLALIATSLLAMPRWYPHWVELASSTRATESFFYEVTEFPFLGLRLFVPEAFGISYWATFNTIAGLSSVFQKLSVQIFSHFPHYFGTVSLLMLLAGMPFAYQDKSLKWGYLCLLAILAILLAVEPLNTILRQWMHPWFHLQSVHFLLTPIACGLLAHLGKKFETLPEFRPPVWVFLVVVLALLYTLVVWSLNFQGQWHVATLTKMISLFAALLFYFRGRFTRALWMSTLAVGSACALFLVKSHNPIFLNHLRILLSLIFSLACYLVMGPRPKWGMTILLGVFLVVISLVSGVTPELFVLESKQESVVLAGLGLVKALLIAGVFFNLCREQRNVFTIGCFTLLLWDLVPSAKIHTHLVFNPFYSAESPYPEKAPIASIDLNNYRVNYPNLFSVTPLYHAIYRNHEVLSAMHSVYGVRSYGGYVNSVPRRYTEFVESFLAPAVKEKLLDQGKHGYLATLSDPRLLDLLGVGYDFSAQTASWSKRDNALSRFTFFESYALVPQEKALALLQSHEFNPNEQVVLETDPGFSPRVPTPSRPVPYQSQATDRLKIQWQSDTPGVLLFNDSYHSGWRARIDGKSHPLLRANYAFMAVEVPPGRHEIEFEFLPAAFLEGIRWAKWGVFFVLASAIFLALVEFWAFSGKRQRQRLSQLADGAITQ